MSSQDSLFQPASDATMSGNTAIALRNFSQQMRVAMPARVEALGENGTVTVQPGFQAVSAAKVRSDGKPDPITLKALGNVPIMQPQGASYVVQLPVAVGDTGLLVFTDRSLDAWLAGDGGPQNPNDPRLHHLSDAIFVPGLLTTAGAATQASNGTDLVLQNGLASLHVQAAGTYKIGNAISELVSLVQQVAAGTEALATAAAALNVIGTASVDPVSKTALTAASTKLTGLSAKIATLVGT